MNLQSVKSANRSSVLYLLNEYKLLSRKEIAQKLSLTPAAVTKICQSLIEDGYIKESDSIQDTGKSGRREILLELLLSDKYIFGINAQMDKITYSISSLDGVLIKSYDTDFNVDLDIVIKNGKDFLQKSNFDQSLLIGMGVCVIGSINDNYSVWNNENIEKVFSDAFSLDVIIENNIKAFAQSELIYGDLKNKESLLFFKWGAGIGSCIVANGKIFSGSDSGIAEIGHYIVDTSGKKCRCGRFGCLETVASTDAIIEEIGKDLSIIDIVTSQNNDIINMLDHKIDLVALVLTNTATILNTNKVIIFGEMFKNQVIVEKLQKQCKRYNANMKFDTISLSKLNNISDYIGTVAICAKYFYFEGEV